MEEINKVVLVSALHSLRERESERVRNGESRFYNAAIADILNYLGEE